MPGWQLPILRIARRWPAGSGPVKMLTLATCSNDSHRWSAWMQGQVSSDYQDSPGVSPSTLHCTAMTSVISVNVYKELFQMSAFDMAKSLTPQNA